MRMDIYNSSHGREFTILHMTSPAFPTLVFRIVTLTILYDKPCDIPMHLSRTVSI